MWLGGSVAGGLVGGALGGLVTVDECGGSVAGGWLVVCGCAVVVTLGVVSVL